MQKYRKIYQDIVLKIMNRQWQHMLPSEHELSQMYEASRETIRKALALLSQEGYIQKVHGKGSLIIEKQMLDFPVSGIVSFKEMMHKQGIEATTSVELLEQVQADAYQADCLDISVGASMWQLIRVREINGEKVILDLDYLNQEIVEQLPMAACQDSIYEYLEGQLGLGISFAQKEITVENPTAHDIHLLDMEGFSNVVVIRSKVYLEDARLFQFTESRHRPDKFRFVDFARRVHG